jgi:CRISPR type IV-associated protein Csf2
MVKIEGLLVTKSPLHIASPEERRFDFRTMRFTNQKEAVPCTPTTKMGLVRPAEMRHETEEGTMIATEAVPVIPANDLRGRLRREAADIRAPFVRARRKALPRYLSCHDLRRGLWLSRQGRSGA